MSLFPIFSPTSAQAALTTITQVLSAIGNNNASIITAPSGIQAGDLIVMLDYCSDLGGPLVTPTNFTLIASSEANTQRMVASYKLANGTEGGTSITGMACAAANGSPKLIYVFRGDVPATAITVSTPNNQNTTGNPTAQNVIASGGLAPLVILGFYGAFTVISPRTFTVSGSAAKDGEINKFDGGVVNDADAWLAYKIYNSAPQDAVIDMDDESGQILMSCYIQLA